MSVTKLLDLASQEYLGTLKFSITQIDLGSYATGGVVFPKEIAGISRIIGMIPIAGGAGYVFEFVPATASAEAKIKIYRSAGFTPAGTNGTSAVTGTAAAQTFTGSALGTHTHTVPSGTDGAGGTTGATSGGTPAGTNGTSAVTGTAAAQTFTGTAVAAGAMVEVANGVNLAAVDPTFLIIGA